MGHFKKFLLTLVIGALALVSEFVLHQPTWAFILIAVLGSLLAFSMLIEMIQTLRSGRYGVDILAITAIVATLLVGQYWASLVVLIMLTGGDSLEDYASKQASKELRSLLDNSPQIAHKVTATGLVDIQVEAAVIGDQLVVKPGEIVPVDGEITEGSSLFDESSLTGEARPITKQVGDELMSGAVNGDGAVTYTVTKRPEDSQYQTIIKLVKESQEKPAHFVRMADRYAVPFTAVAYLIGGVAWFLSKDPVRFAEVLVVASPCPLILAAPIALVAGMSRTSRNGIVVKTGTSIEKLAAAKTVAFDKTGTITEGQLHVTDLVPTEAFSPESLLQIAASVEQNSSHILARSLVAEAKKRQLAFLPVSDLKEVTGAGVVGVIQQHTVRVGKADFANTVETEQQTSVYVSQDGDFIGKITFTDQIRPEAAATIRQLKELGAEDIMMLTGDGAEAAQEIAQAVGITTVHAECLPKDKITVLKEVIAEKRPVIMVGDGINDAPALAVADIGIAMGAHGSSAASESADAVILKDDLTRVSAAVTISQDTMKIARQSVLIGIFICVGLMLVAATGVIPALLGAALQEVVDTVSILSALRAKNDRRTT
ncbi:heavy metal translocating P-type ATPase [Enterococcus canis]|uniref:Cd(2+)-exporting ATPase n=1 Tax=Enterococcus canis TaxID=214095 RepID=A0A1L8RJ28_9ENTE|nr:heavy metal translocating P-type ATPase [Enterococcus canis]OJG19715.1 heavy metal translocating P-type ATPase [Enterococcus canis]